MIVKKPKQRTTITLKIYHINPDGKREMIGGLSWLFGLNLRRKGAKFVENGVAYSISKLFKDIKPLKHFSLLPKAEIEKNESE